MPRVRPVVATFLLVLVAGCTPMSGTSEPGDEPSATEESPPAQPAGPAETEDEDEDDADGAGEAADEPERTWEAVDPAEVDANQLGVVPVLMYHRVMEDAASEWDITPDEFRQELQYLYDNDYYPITTVELARAEIDVPPGKTPVVLTFDDTVPEQFDYADDGEIDPDTAVGIMLDFAEQNPDFPAVGSFYVTDKLFDDPANGHDMFAHLDELGFEIGNHTVGHANLAEVGAEEVERQLAGGVENIRQGVPDAEVATMSLPLGRWPEPRELAFSGSYDGVDYDHEGILLVGAHPSESPFDAAFDPLAIPRIRSAPTWDGEEATYESAFWLDVLERNPGMRYVSDGDPETISFPEDTEVELAAEFEDRANPY